MLYSSSLSAQKVDLPNYRRYNEFNHWQGLMFLISYQVLSSQSSFINVF